MTGATPTVTVASVIRSAGQAARVHLGEEAFTFVRWAFTPPARRCSRCRRTGGHDAVERATERATLWNTVFDDPSDEYGG